MVSISQQGFYPDPPARRFAYDDDGSITALIVNGVVTQWSTGQMQSLNSEAFAITIDRNSGEPGGYLTMLFPELRDVSHAFRNLSDGTYSIGSHTQPWEISTDTTNGIDGTWVTNNSYTAYIEPTSPNYRIRLGIIGSTNTKGIRWFANAGGGFNRTYYCQWHIYGQKSAGQTPHRIDFCDSSGNELLIDQDYGDQPRNSTRIWSPSNTWNQSTALYLKNRSTTKQATDVNVTFETLAFDMTTYLGLSKDNITYGTTVNYSTINPQQVVGPIYVRHNPGLTASLSVKTARLQVAVGTWL